MGINSEVWNLAIYLHACHMRCDIKCSMDMWYRVYYMWKFTALHSIIDGTFYVTPSV